MSRSFQDFKKNLLNHSGQSTKLLTGALVLTILVIFTRLNSYTENVNSGLSDNLIRLHVVANSDSPEDQQLKSTVRDAVLEYVCNKVKDSDSIEQTSSIIADNISDIRSVAERTIYSNGSSYDVNTSLGLYPFPTKAYGDIVLPAGEYQALRIVIGKGYGANWWCVLFPPLCFVDVTHGTVPDEVKDDLKRVLSEEEYDLVTSSGDESDIPVKIRFKIVELFQDSKIKLAGAFEKLFSSEKS